ncbi:MAG: SRPBCC domain-containing protein [Nitrososphaerales archaeon]|nr:SRPBCC domain-containing protein [Nitrososphaerales archaeon]
MSSQKFGTIRQRVTIDAPPSEVYDTYVNARRHSEFTGSTATGTARKGAKFEAWDGYISGKFLELEKGKRVVQEWKTSEWPTGYPPSILELRFRGEGGKTELSMVHSKVPAEQVQMYNEGWVESYWGPLKEYFKQRGRAGS